MDCKKAQMLSDRYLKEGLPVKELPEFLAHINSCPVCRESLTTDYSITKAIDQLNRGEDFSTDYSHELTEQLEHSRQLVRRKNRLLIVRRIAVFLVLVAIAALLSFYQAPAKFRYLAPGEQESLRIRHYGIDERYDPVRNGILDYNDDVIEEFRKRDLGR